MAPQIAKDNEMWIRSSTKFFADMKWLPKIDQMTEGKRAWDKKKAREVNSTTVPVNRLEFPRQFLQYFA